MNKLIAIGLSLILLVAFSACGTQKSSSENKKNTNEVQNPGNTSDKKTQGEVKVVITPPAGWNPVQGSVLPVQYLKNTASFMAKKENFTGKNIGDVVKEAKEIYSRSFKDVKYVGEVENITIDGKEAGKIIFTCNISNMQMKYEYVYLFVDEKVYVITFGDLEKTFDSLSADYEKILNDIKFEIK